MGSRYLLSIKCPQCQFENNDVYYAPTCGFVDHKCKCGHVIDLEEETGISYEDASNRGEIETLVNKIANDNKRE